jgi:hypothetical protein
MVAWVMEKHDEEKNTTVGAGGEATNTTVGTDGEAANTTG